MNRAKQHANNRDGWETPKKVFSDIDDAFVQLIYLDVAADANNAKCYLYFTEKDNALEIDWATRHLWFCNPPYSLKEKFLDKATEQLEKGYAGIMLLPASVETKWFRKHITEPNRIRMFYPRRIPFIDPDTGKPGAGNCGGSVIVCFGCVPNGLILNEPWITNSSVGGI